MVPLFWRHHDTLHLAAIETPGKASSNPTKEMLIIRYSYCANSRGGGGGGGGRIRTQRHVRPGVWAEIEGRRRDGFRGQSLNARNLLFLAFLLV